MKAAQINQYGDNSVIKVVDVAKPTLSEGQVLVEVYASSLNPVDSAIRAGYMQEMTPLQLPATLGGDIAGRVVEVANGVESYVVGDEVYGQALATLGASGAFAEYAAANISQIAKMPANVDFQQAASLPLTAASAIQALTQHIGLKEGQKIFVHGAAGGVGMIAVQVAKALGAYVAATATGDGTAFVKQLGADEVIDYKAEDFAEKLHDFDAVLNTVLGDEFNKTLNILKAGGVAVSLVGSADEALAEDLGVTAIIQFTQVSTDVLSTLSKWIESGEVVPQVAKVYSLDEIVQAFEYRENNTINGKIVVAIK